VPPAPRLVLAGVAGFAAIVLVEHALRPGLSPLDRYVSEYARGSTAPLQVVAFLLWAVATAASAVLAARIRPPGRPLARVLAVCALAAAAAGLLLAAAFTTQTVAGELPAGVRRTTGGRLHDLGTLLILGGLLAGGVASLRLVRGLRYRLAAVGLALALVAVVPILVALRLDAPGLGQRAFIVVGLAWQVVFARAYCTPIRSRAGTASGELAPR
jgi:hypothetical protein